MRKAELARLCPVCPVCRLAGRELRPLELGSVAEERGGDVIQGILLCPSPSCRREHPIVDGIPIVVADLAAFMRTQADALLARDDLAPLLAGVVGDSIGADAGYNERRYLVGSYVRGHYGDQLADDAGEGLPALFEAGLGLLDAAPAGLWLDVGCATGRASFELAARTGDTVLACDLNVAMLRLARRLAGGERVTAPVRKGGVVYDTVELGVETAHRDKVSFWACDATALPFANDLAAGAVSFNMLDSVASPVTHLAELGRLVRPGGDVVLSTPYDWNATATPMPGWIGGHSQRADSAGDGAAELRRLLSDAAPPELGIRLRLAAEIAAHPWRVPLHDRAAMLYQVHLVAAKATA